jgi:hypothetical protein
MVMSNHLTAAPSLPSSKVWSLKVADGRFDEFVQAVLTHGQQRVTVGANSEIVVTADMVAGKTNVKSGLLLVLAMQASPLKDIDITPERYEMPVSDPAF